VRLQRIGQAREVVHTRGFEVQATRPVALRVVAAGGHHRPLLQVCTQSAHG
jgi:hypothetical protein